MKVYLGLLTTYMIINGAIASTSSTIQGNTGASVESVTHSGGVKDVTDSSKIKGTVSHAAKTPPPAATTLGEHQSQGVAKNAVTAKISAIHETTAAPVLSVTHPVGGPTATKSSIPILPKHSTAAEKLPLILIGKHHTPAIVKKKEGVITTVSSIHNLQKHSTAVEKLPLIIAGLHHASGTVKNDLPKLLITYNSLHNNTMHITCFLEYGPLPIRYELMLGDRKVQEVTVHIAEPANFTILMTPGRKVKCKARSSSGMEVTSDIVSQSLYDDTPKREDEEDDGDKDSGPKHLIALHFILTSVDPQVQKRNTLLLCICGPTILFVLVTVILLTYLRNRREHRMEM